MKQPLVRPVARISLFLAGACALALSWGAVASATPVKSTLARVAAGAQASAVSTVELSGAERTRVLSEAGAALQAQRRVQGEYTQAGSDGSRDSGRFYLQRPGRVRFESSALTIVSDGTTVAIHNHELDNIDRVPLRSLPLHFVLAGTVNLDEDFRITRVARRGDAVLITARDREGEIDGELTLVLAASDYALRAWEALDATGFRSTVTLRNVETVQRLSPRLWILEDDADPTDRRGGR